jgi:hypothetical protein
MISAFLCASSVLLGGAALVCVLISSLWSVSVVVPNEVIQRSFSWTLPEERVAGLYRWRLETADLTVLSGGRIGFSAQLHGSVGNMRVAGSLKGMASLSYSAGSLVLSTPVVTFSEIIRDTAARSPVSAIVMDAQPTGSGKVGKDIESAGDGGRIADVFFKGASIYHLQRPLPDNLSGFSRVTLRTDGHRVVVQSVLNPW